MEQRIENCSLITCDECGTTNVLELTAQGERICPEELLECWSCGSELFYTEETEYAD